jgi:16S rRNA (guanine966-N2)-methyltransferase
MSRPVVAGAGRIRIVGGRLRNSRLDVPNLPGLRPTPERVRETLFNWLQPVVAGATCLDLFAGTGALGLEALSRGAGRATFVERDAQAVAALRANLTRLQQVAASVFAADVAAWLQTAATAHDLVFMDPPFALDRWHATAQALETHGWLGAHAWIYVECARATVWQPPPTWHVHRQGHAGEVAYTLYRRHPGDPLS